MQKRKYEAPEIRDVLYVFEKDIMSLSNKGALDADNLDNTQDKEW